MAQKRGVGVVRSSTPNAPPRAANSPGQAQSSNSASERGFLTDVEVTGSRFGGRERQLQAWAADDGAGGIEDGLGGAAGGLEGPNRAVVKGNGQWDQFATNEKLYGLRTDYNEDLYTTKLDRSGADYRQREAKAAQLEREILKGTGLANNAHMAEERGVAGTDDSGLDEEDKYGAVIRGPDAYVPPGARKAWAAKAPAATPPATNGSNAPSPAPPAAAPATATAAVSPSVTITASAAASAAARHADPAILSTSRVPPAIAKAGTAAGAGAAATATKKEAPPLHKTFSQFVSTERERLQQKREAVVKAHARQEQDSKLASLLEFSQTFKLPKPVPEDISTLLGKKPTSQATTPAVSPTPQARTLPAMPAPASTATATPAPPVKVSLPTKAAAPAPTPTRSAGLNLPAIPPFNPNKNKPAPAAASPSVSPAPVAASTASTASSTASPAVVPKASTSKISATAAPFVFKPNPNASSFTPTLSAAPTPARKPSDAGSIASTAATPASPAVAAKSLSAAATPFFTKPIKKNSTTMRVKEDFTPFKNGVVPEPTSIIPQWSQFTGKSFRSLYAGDEPGQGQDPALAGAPPAGPHPMMHPGGPIPQGFNPYQAYQPNFGGQPPRGGPGGFAPLPPGQQPQMPPHMTGPPPPHMNPAFNGQFAQMGGFPGGPHGAGPMFNPQQMAQAQAQGGVAPPPGGFMRYNPNFIPPQGQGGAQPGQAPMGFVEGGPGRM